MLLQVVKDNWRLLTFRKPSAFIGSHWHWYLGFGLVMTWLAGIGRYWDNPRAHLAQYLGLGSLAYVILLALFLWLLVAPLKPRRWSLTQVLIFVTLCSPPALLYAIPVERFMSLPSAQATNAWFLAIVASWRVALLAFFLIKASGLRVSATIVATLLPITLIVVTLTALNLEHVVFSLMAGVDLKDHSAADTAYVIVLLLSFLSMWSAPVLVVWYGVLVYLARRRPS